ncbi:hypothetical protein HOK51_09845 [Candidatus Woesearchaeota archaeon]|jgi:hypothetical protein|nr:hypothetical protein [Candidatus Woesearchaeota archaeon]MBT6520126.1 hypothetical protein [Candidatus Woesearchaeota archaeon]
MANIPGEKLEHILALAEVLHKRAHPKSIFDESGNTFAQDEVIDRAKERGIDEQYVQQAIDRYVVSSHSHMKLLSKLGAQPSLNALVKCYEEELVPVLKKAFPTEEFVVGCPDARSKSSINLNQFYVYSIQKTKTFFGYKKNKTKVLNISVFYGGGITSDSGKSLKGSKSQPSIAVSYWDARVMLACENKLDELKKACDPFIDKYFVLAE